MFEDVLNEKKKDTLGLDTCGLVTNCFLWPRPDGEYMFFERDEKTLANLNGYAILPVEEYVVELEKYMKLMEVYDPIKYKDEIDKYKHNIITLKELHKQYINGKNERKNILN